MLAKELKYCFHVIFRPIDGFWDLKHEKRGSVKAAMIILAVALLTFIISSRYTGFLFNPVNQLTVNLFREVAVFLAVFVLFVISNWCLTTLMDGKGTIADIAVATAYALTPYILINLPLVLLSNHITLAEAAFYNIFLVLGIIWTGGLIFLGTMVTHEYSIFRTLLTLFFVVVGMMIMVFLALLFFSVIQRMVGLVYVIYKEITFRM